MTPWDAIARRDFTDWHGLPADAAYASFDDRFPRLSDAEAAGMLGSHNVPARYRVHVAEGYPLNLQAWFMGSRLVLIEADVPRLVGAPAELFDALGPPAATVDFTWDVLAVPQGGHIHPDRGITVFVGPEGQVLRLALYAPTDVAHYHTELHHETKLTELPFRPDTP